jgi:hypothetical protein
MIEKGWGVKSKNEPRFETVILPPEGDPSLIFQFFIAQIIYMRTLFGLSVDWVDYPWIRLTILVSSLDAQLEIA